MFDIFSTLPEVVSISDHAGCHFGHEHSFTAGRCRQSFRRSICTQGPRHKADGHVLTSSVCGCQLVPAMTLSSGAPEALAGRTDKSQHEYRRGFQAETRPPISLVDPIAEGCPQLAALGHAQEKYRSLK